MIALLIDILLLVCGAILVYAWVVYPAALGLVAWRSPRLPAGKTPDPGDAPRVTVVLSAHNEESVIRDRLENLLELDYPHGRLLVRVGIDGGSDATAPIAREVAARDARVIVYPFPENRGKVSVLKDLVASSGSEILVFTDANTRFRHDALRRLVGHFSDASVGGVCGRLVFMDTNPFGVDEGQQNPSPEGAYWRWETRLKRLESRVDSCLGANGAIYAVRRDRFWRAIPDNTVIDDFVIGMKVREQGSRMIYDGAAVAYEELPEEASEWGRRIRIGAGAYQSMALCRSSMAPRQGRFAWCFLSHKVLRWLTPHLMALAAGLSVVGVFLSACPVMHAAHVGVLAGTVSSLLCVLLSRTAVRLPGVSHLAHFMSMQGALAGGFVRYLRGDLRGSWTRTPRGAD